MYLRTPWKIGENLIGQPHKIKKLISYLRLFFVGSCIQRLEMQK